MLKWKCGRRREEGGSCWNGRNKTPYSHLFKYLLTDFSLFSYFICYSSFFNLTDRRQFKSNKSSKQKIRKMKQTLRNLCTVRSSKETTFQFISIKKNAERKPQTGKWKKEKEVYIILWNMRVQKAQGKKLKNGKNMFIHFIFSTIKIRSWKNVSYYKIKIKTFQ